MKHFYQECLNDFSKDCSEKIMRDKGISVEIVNQCFDNSFQRSQIKQSLQENQILSKEKLAQENSGLTNYPQIVINGQIYKGSQSQDDLLMSFCSSLNNETAKCRQIELYDDDEFSVF